MTAAHAFSSYCDEFNRSVDQSRHLDDGKQIVS